MVMKIDEDKANLDLVNKKLESFCEIVMQRMIEIQATNKELLRRIAALEKQVG